MVMLPVLESDCDVDDDIDIRLTTAKDEDEADDHNQRHDARDDVNSCLRHGRSRRSGRRLFRSGRADSRLVSVAGSVQER